MKQPAQEIPCNLWQASSHFEQWLIHDLIIQLLFRNGPPWNQPLEQLIKNNPNGPSITTVAVPIIFQSLRRHVDRRSNIIGPMLQAILSWNGKSKITNLVRPILVENISRLNITMQVATLINVKIPIDNLLDNLARLIIGELFFLF